MIGIKTKCRNNRVLFGFLYHIIEMESIVGEAKLKIKWKEKGGDES